ncbi:MAG: putative Ig domain-containing protein [Rubrivivax sp.]|nr:putative Ig domain-containing protein [Rubrivivax sp.]
MLSATGGTGIYAWAVAAGTLPAGLALSAAGEIAGTPTAFGTDTITISVTSGTQVITKVFALTVVPSLTITTASLPEGTVGEPYADTLRALGAGPVAAWGVESGALPAGLTLLSSGVLSGTPTTAGTSDFTGAGDERRAGRHARAAGRVVVAALVLETSDVPRWPQRAIRYSQALAASGGTGSYEWSVVAGALPAGLSFSAAGLLDGTPTTPSNNTFTLRVTSGAQQRERAFSVQISSADAASVVITPNAASVELGDSLQLAAEALDAGGVPLPGRPIAWSTLDASVATVSGSQARCAASPSAALASSRARRVRAARSSATRRSSPSRLDRWTVWKSCPRARACSSARRSSSPPPCATASAMCSPGAR